jgi:hypothetical protein
MIKLPIVLKRMIFTPQIRMTIKKPALLLLFFCIALTSATSVWAQADSDWEPYASDTGIFRSRVLKDHKVEINVLRIDPKTLIHSETVSSVVDERPFRNALRKYTIRVEQTLGEALTDEEINNMIDFELKYYTNYFRSKGGLVKTSEKNLYSNIIGGELYISYEDPKMEGLQGLRVRTVLSESTKVTQMVEGPDSIMRMLPTNDFFNSMVITPGLTKKNGELLAEWKTHVSPLEIFSATLPPVAPPYIMEEPAVNHAEKSESMGIVVNDPVRGQKIFYNIYGYRLDRDLSFADAQKVALKRHVSKHLDVVKGIEFERNTKSKFPMMSVDYAIKAPEQYPYLGIVKLRVTFMKNYMIVQELVTSRDLAESPLVASLLSLVMFHPEKAYNLATGAAFKKTTGPAENAPVLNITVPEVPAAEKTPAPTPPAAN